MNRLQLLEEGHLGHWANTNPYYRDLILGSGSAKRLAVMIHIRGVTGCAGPRGRRFSSEDAAELKGGSDSNSSSTQEKKEKKLRINKFLNMFLTMSRSEIFSKLVGVST